MCNSLGRPDLCFLCKRSLLSNMVQTKWNSLCAMAFCLHVLVLFLVKVFYYAPDVMILTLKNFKDKYYAPHLRECTVSVGTYSCHESCKEFCSSSYMIPTIYEIKGTLARKNAHVFLVRFRRK